MPVWPVSATPTLAHVGPLARCMRDVAPLFSVVAGSDRRDPFSVQGPVPDVLGTCDASVTGLRIAYSPTLGYARPDPEVVQGVERAVGRLEELGCRVDVIDAVFERDPADLWITEFCAGVGTRLRPIVEAQRDLPDPAVAEVPSAALRQEMCDYYAKFFERYALRETTHLLFERYDVLVSPAVPLASFPVGVDIPEALSDRNLVSWVFYAYPFNLTGQPAAALCAGLAADGMPVGLQIVGRTCGEANVVRLAAAYERAQPPGYNVRPLMI